MALADFDATSTARRIQDVADGARTAFEAHAEQSAQLDAAAREAAAKEVADLEAARQRRADAEAGAKPEPAKQDRPSRTLKLGARDDDVAAEPGRPARRRPPRPEVDDDMSGRTWLR